MPDPYSVQVPRWLQEDAQPVDATQLGSIIGKFVGAATVWAGDQAKGGDHPSFMDDLRTADNPNWRFEQKQRDVATQQLGLNLLSSRFNLDSREMQFNLAKQNMVDAQEAKTDIADYTLRWKQEGSGQPKWLLDNPITSSNPTATKWWQGQANAISVQQNREEQNKIRLENSKALVEADKKNGAWMSAYSSAPADVRAQIAELKEDAYETDPTTGKKIPSLEASAILNQSRNAQNLPPWDASPEQVRAFTAQRSQEASTKREQMREQSRMDIEQFKKKYGAAAKGVSREEFVNRHLTTVMQELYSSFNSKSDYGTNGKYDSMKSAQKAKDILESVYDGLQPSGTSDTEKPTGTSDAISADSDGSLNVGGFKVRIQ